MRVNRIISTAWIVALALFTCVAANPSPKPPIEHEIHAGLNKPAKEISPGLYQHEFEHVANDGVKTSLAYLARKVKHLVELADSEVGFVALKCRQGNIVEMTVTNSTAPLLWTAGTADVNATILVGNDDISCSDQDGDDGQGSILHRVLKAPVLVSADENEGQYVYSLLAEGTHFSHAFEHLSLQFYRGKHGIAAAKANLAKAENEAGAKLPQTQNMDNSKGLRRRHLLFFGSGSSYDCHSNCATCDGTGSDDCTSCDSSSSLPKYLSGYVSGGYCYECTQDSHCGTGVSCTDYACVDTCHSNCATCDGTGSDDCTSCDSSSSLPKYLSGYVSGGYCYECTQDSHCGTGVSCTDYACVDTCHSNCATCDGTGSDDCTSCDSSSSLPKYLSGYVSGAKGIAVLHHLPIFRHFFHFHKNPSSSVLSGTFSRENCFPPKPKKRPKIAKHTKHEPLPKRDAISLKFP
jgi:hypothetical protein